MVQVTHDGLEELTLEEFHTLLRLFPPTKYEHWEHVEEEGYYRHLWWTDYQLLVVRDERKWGHPQESYYRPAFTIPRKGVASGR